MQTTTTPSNSTTFQLSTLQPFTAYVLKIRSVKTIGDKSYASEYSEEKDLKTLDGKPGEPRDLGLLDRNETCLKIHWKPPSLKNGVLIQYKIVVQTVYSEEQVYTLDENVDTLGAPQLQICNLKVSSQYVILVSALTRTQEGDQTLGVFKTKLSQPPPPPTPIVQNTSSSTITVLLKPAVIDTGPVSAYYIVVQETKQPLYLEELSWSSEGSFEDPVLRLNIKGYTAGVFTANEMQEGKLFIVGDNKQYGGFINVPLKPNGKYRVIYILSSQWDLETKMSYSQTDLVGTTITTIPTSKTTTLQSTKAIVTKSDSKNMLFSQKDMSTLEETTTSLKLLSTNENDFDWKILLLIILLILFLLLVLLFCFFCFRYRKSKPMKNIIEKSKMSKNQFAYKNFQSPEEPLKWTPTSTIDEKRFPIYHDDPTKNPNNSVTFGDEFKQLPATNSCYCTQAKLPENKNKNRFDHILPFDSSRVILKTNKSDRRSDYINASYIFENTGHHAYIASQGPFNQQTICDFWAMVYEHQASAIIMLTNTFEDNIVKSEQYWPSDDTTRKYGKVTVTIGKISVFSSFITRDFILKNILEDQKEMFIRQYHFTAWESEERNSLFLDFWRKVTMDQKVQNKSGHWVIHCSTGVSRTGVFIAVDHCLNKFDAHKGVNVFRTCHNMRKYRAFMVRTYKHYKMVYDVLHEAMAIKRKEMFLDLTNTVEVFNELKQGENNTVLMKEQFYLCERLAQKTSTNDCLAALENKVKNRFNALNLLPKDAHRVHLFDTEYPSKDLYINASFVDSHVHNRHFITTQDPLQTTSGEFWKMIYETDCRCIVDMNPLDRPCEKYLQKENDIKIIDKYSVKVVNQLLCEGFVRRILSLSCLLYPYEKERTVCHYEFRDWVLDKNVPSSRISLIKMISDMDQKTQLLRPVVVHCLDASSHSGLLCACVCLWMCVQLGEQVDVFHLVKKLKNRRSQFIPSHNQYSFLFKFLWESLNNI